MEVREGTVSGELASEIGEDRAVLQIIIAQAEGLYTRMWTLDRGTAERVAVELGGRPVALVAPDDMIAVIEPLAAGRVVEITEQES